MGDRLWIDLETYSTVDLRNATPYRYAEDPRFEILMAAWSRDGETVQVALGHEAIRSIPGLWDDEVLKVAHNAAFERVCLSRLAGLPTGRYLDPTTYHDTMAIAAERGYPLGLKNLALALGAEEKDEAGTRLINIFCKPNKKGERNLPEDHPMDWLDFIQYCEQDVYTLIDVDRRLGGWPTEVERLVYLSDQAVNDRGIRVDVAMAKRAVAAADANQSEHVAEMCELTGVDNPNSNQQMMQWCKDTGLKNTNLQAATVEELLSGDLQPVQRRVMELRQELALVASKKYSSALSSVSSDGRLRGSFRFFGAHTGRWSGRGTQLQNLPRAQLASEGETEAAILDLALGLGADSYTLKALVRAMFTGPFSVVDYSSIEARVLAWLADETWALDAFRAGRDIYVETAERMSTPNRQLTRSQGKVAVLALGYNGSLGSLRVMGAEGDDEELSRLVHQWRRANRRIVNMWSELDDTFRTGGRIGKHLSVERDGTSRFIVLPSGRSIAYHSCTFGTRTKFRDRNGNHTDTYGGRLTENVTQAVARDVMAEAIVRLERRGYPVVGHVHDEVLVEDPELSTITDIMVKNPPWAKGLPIDGEGFTTARYRKG